MARSGPRARVRATWHLSNLLSDRRTITGVVDWDEFGLNSPLTT
jgi:hypothetical protein